jgi:hypothetical protein
MIQILGMKGTESSPDLDRSAAANLWRNTLSQIPSVFGRLVYISSLRNPNNGRYEHHGLALVYGEDQANKALKKSHSDSFKEWLTFNLEQQKRDMQLYIAGLPDDPRQVIQTWMRLAPYRNLIPAAVRGVERKLYIQDLTIVLEMLKNAYAADAPGRAASQSL